MNKSGTLKIEATQHFQKPNRILFVGATKNFFKIGFYTIHYLQKHHPEIKMRLAIPNIEDAIPSCRGAQVELVKWNPEKPETLNEVFKDCDASLLVPPINNRINVSRKYIEMSIKYKLKFLINIGVQFKSDCQDNDGENVGPSLIQNDAAKVIHLLDKSGIKYCNLNLPMFLENLLYQVDDIYYNRTFGFPCSPNASFSYVSCEDLAEIVGEMFAYQQIIDDTRWTANNQVKISEIQLILSQITNQPIKYNYLSDNEFIQSLMMDTGSASSYESANKILQIWKKIERGEDMQPNKLLQNLLGREPQSALTWIVEHRCCFNKHPDCKHPQPPRKQQNYQDNTQFLDFRHKL
eukprot:403348524